MANTAQLNVKSGHGFNQVFLQQDVNDARTIVGLVDKDSHVITGCSATSDGTSFTGTTVIKYWWHTFTDKVVVTIDPTTDEYAMSVAGLKVFSGVLDPNQAAAAVAFVKACKLPSLAD